LKAVKRNTWVFAQLHNTKSHTRTRSHTTKIVLFKISTKIIGNIKQLKQANISQTAVPQSISNHQKHNIRHTTSNKCSLRHTFSNISL